MHVTLQKNKSEYILLHLVGFWFNFELWCTEP